MGGQVVSDERGMQGMRRDGECQDSRPDTSGFPVLVFCLAASLLIADCSKAEQTNKDKDYINYISFSYDSKKILFDRQKGSGPYQIQVYDLVTHELSAYQPPADEQWSMAKYSNDGKHIVFCIIPRHVNRLDIGNMHIATMDPDGKHIRKITNTNGPNIYPSYSHSGDKIIFAKGKMRSNGKTPAAGFDIYEVNTKTGNETRLTWFNVFSISPPQEFPDGKTIIFGAYGFPEMGPEIENINNIFIVNKGEKKLPVPLVRLDSNNPLLAKASGTKNPLISRDGKQILFETVALRTDGVHGEGHQFYEYSRSGKYRRVTNIIPSSIWSATLSLDGLLAIVIHPVFDETGSNKIAICNTKDGTSKLINLPEQPSRFINH